MPTSTFVNTEASTLSEKILQARKEHTPRGLGVAHPVVAHRATGALLTDVDGREFIDFVGGIGVMNVGHTHPRVVQAVKTQLELLSHPSIQVVTYEPYVQLAERLNRIAPVRGVAKTLLVTTGAEAVENAVKIARAATKRSAIITFHNGFHGRTLLGMTLTGKAKPYHQNFGPFAPEVYQAPFPYEYRGWSSDRALEAFDDLLRAQVAPDRVAAVLLEPVQGEGGFIPAPQGFLEGLRERADKHGFLLIADEIQTGFGRTGKMFALEHTGVKADLVTVAKSLAGGLPLAGVVGTAELMDAPDPGGLGGTYGGNPLACAAANAVLDLFEAEDLLGSAVELGDTLRRELESAAGVYTSIGEIRGIGPMLAFELVQDLASREPAPELAQAVVAAARDRGLLLLTAGMFGNVIRFLAPLQLDDATLERALGALRGAFSEALRTR